MKYFLPLIAICFSIGSWCLTEGQAGEPEAKIQWKKIDGNTSIGISLGMTSASLDSEIPVHIHFKSSVHPLPKMLREGFSLDVLLPEELTGKVEPHVEVTLAKKPKWRKVGPGEAIVEVGTVRVSHRATWGVEVRFAVQMGEELKKLSSPVARFTVH